MLDVEYWAEVRRLRRMEGLAIWETARVMGVARNTVKAALVAEGPPQYRRAPAVAALSSGPNRSGVNDRIALAAFARWWRIPTL